MAELAPRMLPHPGNFACVALNQKVSGRKFGSLSHRRCGYRLYLLGDGSIRLSDDQFVLQIVILIREIRRALQDPQNGSTPSEVRTFSRLYRTSGSVGTPDLDLDIVVFPRFVENLPEIIAPEGDDTLPSKGNRPGCPVRSNADARFQLNDRVRLHQQPFVVHLVLDRDPPFEQRRRERPLRLLGKHVEARAKHLHVARVGLHDEG